MAEPLPVRRATLADARAIAWVQVDSWRAAYRGLVSQRFLDDFDITTRQDIWARALTQPRPDEVLFQASDGAGPVGFAYGSPGDDASYELGALYLLPAVQRQGLGRRLVGRIAATALVTGATRLTCASFRDAPAADFYRRLGGQVVGEATRSFGSCQLPVLHWAWDAPLALLLPPGARLAAATSDAEFAAARALIEEYQAWLAVDLCFQGFAAELASLPTVYGPPRGQLLLAWQDDRPVGCVGLRALDAGLAELKRLWVRPSHWGSGLGRALAAAITGWARQAGYAAVRLDSLRRLSAALQLYDDLDYRPIPPYRANPEPEVVYLERRWEALPAG
ncbi:MAG: GNAT family N-acetyltransferase [Fimbriimonadaceae bacterium]|nr:GNAT family N-acetyltransferase [Fimbriimonadaceae bacterium]